MFVVEPRHDPLDIAVENRRRDVEGDRGDGGGGVGPDARQLQQRGVIGREGAAMFRRHDAGAFQQVAGAGVVAEARPGGHDVGVLGGGEVGDRRPARVKASK